MTRSVCAERGHHRWALVAGRAVRSYGIRLDYDCVDCMAIQHTFEDNDGNVNIEVSEPQNSRCPEPESI